MKNRKYIHRGTILILLICATLSCEEDYEFTYQTIVTETPVNLINLNTPYDDYNSALPYEAFRHGIYFSSNRNSAGDNYDIVFKEMDLSYHERDDLINISYVSPTNTYGQFDDILYELNTDYDELGPLFYFGEVDYRYLFYANNASGNFDIKYVSSKKADPDDYILDRSYEALNTEHDELYPFITASEVYFCSDRVDSIFSIYTMSFDEDEINPDSLEVANAPIAVHTTLSSSGDDKCPFIQDDLMVFTSDRAGGYGGFDLYYSKKVNGAWTEPINFGEKVNSPLDEYRPIIVPFYGFEETMLIFSSNREGGKGGFDLYAVRADI